MAWNRRSSCNSKSNASWFLSQHTGGGVHLYNDASGPSKRTGLSTSFAYHVKTGKLSKLSFGLSGSITQFSIDRDKLITQVPGV